MFEKKMLSPCEIEAQAALELPNRQTLCGGLINVTVTDVLNNSQFLNNNFDNINVALQICALVQQINVLSAVINGPSATLYSCSITQNLTTF